MPRKSLTHSMTAFAGHVIKDVYLPQIIQCLEDLSRAQIWWRPNEASNSVGNLVLHLEGNVRQWIVSGLGGQPDKRQRDLEFSRRRSMPRRELAAGLEKTVGEACRVLRKLSAEDLMRLHSIQNFRVTGLEAAFHVAEHFSHHAGQVILLTKMLKGNDLKLWQLPDEGQNKIRRLQAW
jgi:uncharacterized damage-inducible protein DinB